MTALAGDLPRLVPAGSSFTALGTSVEVLVTDGQVIAAATGLLRESLAQIDLACSRFRTDSQISLLHRHPGRVTTVSPLLAQALAVSLRAAELTDGLVDPTVGSAISALGYDCDFDEVVLRPAAAPSRPRAVPGWWRIGFDAATRQVLLPRGVRLDLGSTAKAFAADRAAGELAASLGCGVLVNLGGDIAVAGPAPAGGWRVRVCEAHDAPADLSAPIVSIRSGGLATSSTTRRAWRQGDREVHHIVDPRTGDIARRCWRTATVAAGSCVDANTASTAAIVLCADAVSWLGSRGLPARLVGWCGEVTTVAGWPCEEEAAQ